LDFGQGVFGFGKGFIGKNFQKNLKANLILWKNKVVLDLNGVVEWNFLTKI
jgi:hypothetical protein